MNELQVMLTKMMFNDVGVFNRLDATYIDSLLWRNDVFSMGTFYSNAYGDKYIFKLINWNLDLDQ
jgi:hypothetical protein